MLISINGRRTAPADATVSIFDRGFLFGDAIYEVIATQGRRLFQEAEHLERLELSGEAVGLSVASMRSTLKAEIASLVQAGLAEHEGDLYVRIMITCGRAPGFGLLESVGEPTRIVMVKPLPVWDPRMVNEGLRLKSVSPEAVVGRVAPWVKSNNRQANVMAHRLARAAEFDDALFVDPAGKVSEGPTWNVFCVRGGSLLTPPLERGILPGITRSTVLRCALEEGIPAAEQVLSLEEVREADEAFVTSTTRGVMPVKRLDERTWDQTPGLLTRRLQLRLAQVEA